MKSNEAPEKIYLQQNTTTDCYEGFWPEWFEARAKDTDIEYTRTDSLIEKAVSYIQQNWQWNTKIIEDFKNYMGYGTKMLCKHK